MKNFRLIARLDVKGDKLIKGVHLEGLRIVGNPQERAAQYYQDGVDEIVYMDAVASLYGRNNLAHIVERTAQNVFVPITVGGGVRSVEDARQLLRSGADKIAVNTAATKRPELICELANTFGSQAVVVSIEAKRRSEVHWEALTDCGRERTGLDVAEWAEKVAQLGAGEILLTSVDQEGTRSGLDLDLVDLIGGGVTIPVIASGGVGSVADIVNGANKGADAVAMADILHYGRMSMQDINRDTREAGIPVRRIDVL